MSKNVLTQDGSHPWVILLVALISVLAVGMSEPEDDYSFLDDFDFGAIEGVEELEVEVVEFEF